MGVDIDGFDPFAADDNFSPPTWLCGPLRGMRRPYPHHVTADKSEPGERAGQQSCADSHFLVPLVCYERRNLSAARPRRYRFAARPYEIEIGGAADPRNYFFPCCQSPSIAPVGSTMIENEPSSMTGVTSRITVAPSDFALSVAALMSSTRT